MVEIDLCEAKEVVATKPADRHHLLLTDPLALRATPPPLLVAVLEKSKSYGPLHH